MRRDEDAQAPAERDRPPTRVGRPALLARRLRREEPAADDEHVVAPAREGSLEAALVAAGVAAALVGLAGTHRVEQRINDGRYLGVDPAVDTLLRVAPSGRSIGLAADWSVGGLSPIWPAFGTRIGNEVEFVGHFVDGFLTPYATRRDFQAALRRGRYDVLVVGRGFFPPQATREQRWAIDAGWRTIALSRRLRVLVRPPAAR